MPIIKVPFRLTARIVAIKEGQSELTDIRAAHAAELRARVQRHEALTPSELAELLKLEAK